MSDIRPVPRELVKRARRYGVQLAMRYRNDDESDWQTGQTQNVSASGVLFESTPIGSWVKPRARIEMSLLIPSQIAGGGTSRVACSGRIARIATRETEVLVAATIERFRLQRADEDRE